MTVSVKVNTIALDALIEHWDDGVGHLLDTVAADILKDAQAKAPVRTGFMRDSGQVEPGEDKWSRYIHFTAPYSAYVELGTRFMAAQPFLMPAVELHRRELQDQFSAFFGSFVEK